LAALDTAQNVLVPPGSADPFKTRRLSCFVRALSKKTYRSNEALAVLNNMKEDKDVIAARIRPCLVIGQWMRGGKVSKINVV
jgi:hypothetical protein